MGKRPSDRWYEEQRARYRPSPVRLLLIGESAPDPGDAARRFFYADRLDRHDNLYRGVVEALLHHHAGRAGEDKTQTLEQLRRAGVYLVDLVPEPVNRLPAGERAARRRARVPACVEAVRDLAPAGVAVCHRGTFEALADPLRAARLPLLHDEPIPFPLGNHRARFVELLRRAFRKLPPG